MRKHPGPFKYTNLGTMAIIGRSHAVALLGGFKLTGRLAWLVLVARPFASADRIPQPGHGVHELGLGLRHLWPRLSARRWPGAEDACEEDHLATPERTAPSRNAPPRNDPQRREVTLLRVCADRRPSPRGSMRRHMRDERLRAARGRRADMGAPDRRHRRDEAQAVGDNAPHRPARARPRVQGRAGPARGRARRRFPG